MTFRNFANNISPMLQTALGQHQSYFSLLCLIILHKPCAICLFDIKVASDTEGEGKKSRKCCNNMLGDEHKWKFPVNII